MIDHAVLTGPGTRRHVPRLLALGSVAVVAVGLTTHVLLAATDRATPAAPEEPRAAFAVLDAPQATRDVVAVETLRHSVDPATTRYLGVGPLGTYYLGVSLTGDACLITTAVVDGSLAADAGCTSLTSGTRGVVLEARGPGPEEVALVADGYDVPSGWHAVSGNFVVRDA